MITFGVFQPHRLLLLGAIFLVMSVHDAFGEPGGPDAFYQKNFADAPKVSGEAMMPRESPRVVRKDSSPRESSGQPASSKGEGRVPPALESGKTEEVRTLLSLLVSSQTRGHFESVVRKAFRLAESNRNIKLAEIYHIGDYRNVSPSIEGEARAKGIVLVGLSQVPSIWPVKDSPVWILRDGSGEHIVEGLLQIERCVTPQGDYKEPERSMFEAPATPTIGVKSF